VGTADKLNEDRGGVLCGTAVPMILRIEKRVNNFSFGYKMHLCLPYHKNDLYLKEQLSGQERIDRLSVSFFNL